MDGGADLGAAWAAAMRAGDFARAWELSDRVLAARLAAGKPSWDAPRHLQWIWDGRPLAGRRVLVRCYHGLGDTIQFARFLPLLAAMAREVIVWAPSSLLPLLATMHDAGRLLPLHDGTPDVPYDVDIELMELPHALRITLAALPAEVPYLHPPAAPRLSPELAVGVVPSAGSWDPRRSIEPPLLGRLAAIQGVALYNLLPGADVPGAMDASTSDLLEAASRVKVLDVVVTVDTMMAHLAGALGVPVFTLLHSQPDWRWMTGRADSPWYPTMRLFRQKCAGEWEPAVADATAAIREIAAAHHRF
ncbi:MAG: ADP-heptose--LPS heptosyltransferase [Rhodospirillales bacterium]|nr:ADP-heptose--LPS heptosyltransferase [Rhodospirillales bacterium]